MWQLLKQLEDIKDMADLVGNPLSLRIVSERAERRSSDVESDTDQDE
jgi:hypothetical protein